jgi:hypothetical protein
MADTPKFMTTREAAGYCRLHAASPALMRAQGIGPKYFRPADARRYLYREADLIDWIEGRPDETPEQRTLRFNSYALGTTRVANETGVACVSDSELAVLRREVERDD